MHRGPHEVGFRRAELGQRRSGNAGKSAFAELRLAGLLKFLPIPPVKTDGGFVVLRVQRRGILPILLCCSAAIVLAILNICCRI